MASDTISLELRDNLAKNIIPLICEYLASRGIVIQDVELLEMLDLLQMKNSGGDFEKTCPYTLHKSTTRQGEICNEKLTPDRYFCTKCMKKKGFIEQAKVYSRNTLVSLEKILGEDKYKEYLSLESPPKIPEAVTNRKTVVKIEEMDDTIDINNLTLKPVTDLEGLYSNPDLNFIFSEDMEIVGQWDENGLITPLTPSSYVTVNMIKGKVGKYENHDFGKYKPFLR